jgi:hypothetical protein
MDESRGKQRRAIVISAHRELAPALKVILNRHKILIDTSYDSLSSLLAITKSVRETGNTVFIRKAFSRFVSDWGLPDVMIIDDRIQLAIDSWQDPDNKKILRTLIVSIIIAQATAAKPSPVNIILLDVTDGKSNSSSFEKDPVRILDLLGTDNATIGGVVASLKSKPDHFRKMMKIKVVSASAERAEIEGEMNAFLAGCFIAGGNDTGAGETIVETKIPVPGMMVQDAPHVQKPVGKPAETPVQKTAAEICDVVVRVDDDTCSINGSAVDLKGDEVRLSLVRGEINIRGRWVSRNQRKVHDAIMNEVTSGLAAKLYDDSSVVSVNLTQCEIDQSIISSLISLATKELSRFKDVKILVNFANATMLEKAPGYIMIRKKVYHAY